MNFGNPLQAECYCPSCGEKGQAEGHFGACVSRNWAEGINRFAESVQAQQTPAAKLGLA